MAAFRRKLDISPSHSIDDIRRWVVLRSSLGRDESVPCNCEHGVEGKGGRTGITSISISSTVNMATILHHHQHRGLPSCRRPHPHMQHHQHQEHRSSISNDNSTT